MKIEIINIKSLMKYKKNARKHPASQIEKIGRSIREFGFNNPILIDENNEIIAGHGRLDAAFMLELSEVPCIRLNHLSDKQKKSYMIADNKIALLAEWDIELLIEELNTLSVDEIESTGFDDEEIKSFLNFDENEEENSKEISYHNILKVECDCKNEKEQKKVYDMLTNAGYKCRILSI